MMISFVICHDKKTRGGGQKAHECQKDEGGVRSRTHRSDNRHNTTVWIDSKQGSRYQPHYCLCQRYTETHPTEMLSQNHGRLCGTNKVGLFRADICPDTCCSLHRIRVFCYGKNVYNRIVRHRGPLWDQRGKN
jgi:hypothetical protein